MHPNEDDRVCGTCVHYGHDLAVNVRLPGGPSPEQSARLLAPCLIRAVEADAGPGATVLLGPESHCYSHADAWEPSEDFLEELRDAEDYGVRPGEEVTLLRVSPLRRTYLLGTEESVFALGKEAASCVKVER